MIEQLNWASSCFTELFVHSSPVAYLSTYRSGEFIFQCYIFLSIHTLHGFSRQACWRGLPFPSPVDHILSEFSTMTHQSCMALYGMVHSFIELRKTVIHVIILVHFLWLWFSFWRPWDCSFFFLLLSALWWMRLRVLCKLPAGRGWWWEKLGLALVGKALLSKALNQLLADGWSCIPSLFIVWPEMSQPWGLWVLYLGLMVNSIRVLQQGGLSWSDAASAPTCVVSPCEPTPSQETLQH